MIDQRRLEVLRAFAQKGTMTGAADALFMSTSGVSQHLHALQDEVGIALVERRGRRVELTSAGELLAEFAVQMSALSETALTTMRALKGQYAGDVRLAAFPSFAGAVLPPMLAELREYRPNLNVYVADLEPFESMRALRDGSIDLAIVDDLNDLNFDGMDFLEIGTDELVLCMPEATQSSPEPVGVSSLAEARWLLDGSQDVFDTYLHQMCAEGGFRPHIVARCRNVSVTLALVERGVGVALLSRMHIQRNAFRGQTRSLNPARTRRVRIARRQSSRPSHLIDAVQAAVIGAAASRLGSSPNVKRN